MAEEKKESRWSENTMIMVSRDARAKLKMRALKEGKTLKSYLEDISNGKLLQKDDKVAGV